MKEFQCDKDKEVVLFPNEISLTNIEVMERKISIGTLDVINRRYTIIAKLWHGQVIIIYRNDTIWLVIQESHFTNAFPIAVRWKVSSRITPL